MRNHIFFLHEIFRHKISLTHFFRHLHFHVLFLKFFQRRGGFLWIHYLIHVGHGLLQKQKRYKFK